MEVPLPQPQGHWNVVTFDRLRSRVRSNIYVDPSAVLHCGAMEIRPRRVPGNRCKALAARTRSATRRSISVPCLEQGADQSPRIGHSGVRSAKSGNIGSVSIPSEFDIKNTVERVVAEVSPVRVVLFGSAARGEMRDGSDVDLMVVMPDGTRRLDVAKRLYGLGIPRVDFVVATPELLERWDGSLGLVYRDIADEGRELYAA